MPKNSKKSVQPSTPTSTTPLKLGGSSKAIIDKDITSYFTEIISIIENAKIKIYKAINNGLIGMYWEVGEYISRKISENGWGEGTIKQFSRFILTQYPDIKGFSPQNLWRMKQFYETYKDKPKLSPLVRELTWTNNLLIMTSAKTDEAKEYYLNLCIKNNYSKRELERQLNTMLFERNMLSDKRSKKLIAKNENLGVLRDNYTLEFLNLPEKHKEKDLRRSILAKKLPDKKVLQKKLIEITESSELSDE